MRNAMNEVLRDAYLADNQKGIDYWNRVIEKFDLDWRVRLPHRAFNRNVGVYAGHHFDPDGNLVDEATWQSKSGDWLPTREDSDYVKSLMQPVREPGKMANWIAPPPKGINGQPTEYEYVKL